MYRGKQIITVGSAEAVSTKETKKKAAVAEEKSASPAADKK
jgi:hypothetical protein